MSLEVMTLIIECPENVYTVEGVPISVTGVAQVPVAFGMWLKLTLNYSRQRYGRNSPKLNRWTPSSCKQGS